MKVLTEFQEKFLKEISKTSIKDKFFLTGGTALSAFYLKHRFSDDLDFFTQVPRAINKIILPLEEIVQKLSIKLEISRRFETFLEGTITSEKGEITRFHFAEDAPFRLEPTVFNKKYELYIDTLIDISCNKFSALFERHEMKDFVDIYFIDKEVIKFEELYTKTQKKYVGLDDYWLAYALRYINEISNLPKMIKSVTIEELREFFNEKIKILMNRIKSS
ncbi:MAG: nucleotidyl transferase AbiEii/AbiGii toxin family protein [Candidatus Aminicenantia bacterium]